MQHMESGTGHAGAPENQTVKPVRRLTLCFDGTWNTVESRTNVSRLFEAILDKGADGVEQLKFYDEGVGAAAEATTPWTKVKDALMGGIFGDGVQRNVLQAYCWLIDHYGDQDYTDDGRPEIFIFGFSRGAFTARLLAGLVGACGVLKKDAVLALKDQYPDKDHPARRVVWNNPVVQQAWSHYKPGRSAWRSLAWPGSATAQSVAKTFDDGRRPVPIKLLGVWDTVGKYGIPTWRWGNGFFKPICFSDYTIGRHVLHARHAMAIDEHRNDFNVRPWTRASVSWVSKACAERGKPLPCTMIKQRWFAGAHAQVGGGYENDQLCHHPLRWMAEEAQAFGLGLRVAGAKQTLRFAPLMRDHLAPVIDSHAEFAYGLYRWLSDPIMRQIQVGATSDGERREYSMEIDIDPSVSDKVIGDASYRPVNLYHQGRLDLHALPDTT